MNVIDPISAQDRPDHASPPAPAGQVWGIVRRLALAHVLVAAVPAVLLLASGMSWAHRALPANLAAALSELRYGGVAALPLASSLLALAGLAGTMTMLWARRRAAGEARSVPARRGRFAYLGVRLLRWRLPVAGDPALIGRAARRPQALLVGGLSLAAIVVAWVWRPLPGTPLAPPDTVFTLGGAAILLGFPLLIAERVAATIPEALLPEAPGLRALLLIPALAWPLAGALEIAFGLGLAAGPAIGQGVAFVLGAIGAELALRALGRLFLPPPPAETARAATGSVLARISSPLRDAARSRHPSASILDRFLAVLGLVLRRRGDPAGAAAAAACWALGRHRAGAAEPRSARHLRTLRPAGRRAASRAAPDPALAARPGPPGGVWPDPRHPLASRPAPPRRRRRAKAGPGQRRPAVGTGPSRRTRIS